MANRTQVKDAIKLILDNVSKENQPELIMTLIETIDDEVSYDALISNLISIADKLK